MNKERFVKILSKGKWLMKKFDSLRKGDVFRTFEPNGKEVAKNTISIAMSDAKFVKKLNTSRVRCDNYLKEEKILKRDEGKKGEIVC